VTTHNTHNGQKFKAPAGIEPVISTSKEATNLCLGPRGHWDRLAGDVTKIIKRIVPLKYSTRIELR